MTCVLALHPLLQVDVVATAPADAMSLRTAVVSQRNGGAAAAAATAAATAPVAASGAAAPSIPRSVLQGGILQEMRSAASAATAATPAASPPAVAMASTTLFPSSFPAAAAAAPAALLDGLFLLPWSIDLVGALSQVTQLRDVTGALHLAQQWRQQEARARTSFLLLRILALTRAFELQEEQQHRRSHVAWIPPEEVPLLDSLSRATLTKVASYGKRLREYGQTSA